MDAVSAGVGCYLQESGGVIWRSGGPGWGSSGGPGTVRARAFVARDQDHVIRVRALLWHVVETTWVGLGLGLGLVARAKLGGVVPRLILHFLEIESSYGKTETGFGISGEK